MSDIVVVMDKGKIQQIGTPQDIYNEPKNAFVADFIGESNILDGVMLDDCLVKFFGRKFECVDKGKIQQIGRPEDIYNEPKNAFVADFIGESNILDGVMVEDYLVKFFGRSFQCVDKGFEKNEPVDVVIRPEDIDIVPADEGHLCGTVTSVTFKGVHYDTIVDFKGFKWLIQTTDFCPEGSYIGIRLNPEDIHIMHKSEYSGMFGDYSSYSAEYDEIADAEGSEDEE